MIDLIVWYFKTVWEKDPFEDSKMGLWFGRIWGTLVSPIILLIACIVYGFIQVVEFIEERRWQ